MIVPGTCDLARRDSGGWIFVDIGFSRNSRSCGIAVGDSEPRAVLFGELGPRVAEELSMGSYPLNLLIEAPLSVAFNAKGCPTGRRIEKRGSSPRYWYLQAGAVTLLAATYLLRSLHDMTSAHDKRSERKIRLFEGFASFKRKDAPSSHAADVARLRGVAWGESAKGRIVGCEGLRMCSGDTLRSAFAVAGMDFGIPPVVVVDEAV